MLAKVLDEAVLHTVLVRQLFKPNFVLFRRVRFENRVPIQAGFRAELLLFLFPLL